MKTLLGIFVAGVLVAALPTGLRQHDTQNMNVKICQSGCLNLGNSLTTGLVMFLAANNNWAFGLADISGHGMGLFSLGSPTFPGSPYGGAVAGFVHGSTHFNANNAEINAWLPYGSTARTFAVLYRFTSTSFSTYGPLLFSGTCGSTGSAFEMGVDNSGTVCSNCVWVADNGYGDFVVQTADLKWHVAVGLFPGTSTNATDMRAYLDGRRPSPSTVGSNNTVNTLNAGNGVILGDSTGSCTGVATNAQIAAAWIWNRALTVPEIQQLSADPFGMMYDLRSTLSPSASSTHVNTQPFIIVPH